MFVCLGFFSFSDPPPAWKRWDLSAKKKIRGYIFTCCAWKLKVNIYWKSELLSSLIEAELFTQPRNTHFRLRFYFRSSAAAIFCTETTRTIPSTPTHTVGYILTAWIGKKLLNEQAQEMNEDHSTHRIPGIAYNCGGIFFSILSVFKLTLVQIAVLKLFYALATL